MAPDDAAASRHEPFRFRTAEGLLRKAAALGIDLPFERDISVLFEPVLVGSGRTPNRLAVQPMEGLDGSPDGAPGDLTVRRYRRYAEGGSGLIWFEATAVVPGGRSNPHALLLTRKNAHAFRALVDETRRAAAARHGPAHRPILVLQLTHAGRYSRPGTPQPIRVAAPDSVLDPPHTPTTPWEDDELEEIRDAFIDCARLAREAGFDAVDIKACHGYLVNELLGARARAGSRYGGSFENRSRLLLEIVAGVRRAAPGLAVAVRLNVTDLVPYPSGFGMASDGSGAIDLSESQALVRALQARGCSLLNATLGVPRHAGHFGRPSDRPAGGAVVPEEHPLEGVARLIQMAAAIQEVAAPVPVVGTGYSWLRQYWPYVGAAVVGRGMATFVGLGRGAFAYPDAPRDLMTRGELDRAKCCTACSRCVELMRQQLPTGCVVRDRRVYQRVYRELGNIH